MRPNGLAVIATAMLMLAACARSDGNESNEAGNVVEQEGVSDINSAVSGDELSPIPEASDDMARNGAAPADAGNGAAPVAGASPPPG